MIPAQLRQQGLPRFDFLAGCLPGREAPSDIDQVIEKCGHFLFIECKRPKQTVPRGQQILFDHLVAGPKSIRVITVVGQPPAEISSFGVWGSALRPATTSEVRTYVRAWRDWAASQGSKAA